MSINFCVVYEKGVEVITVEIPIPIKSEDQLVDVFRKAYEKHGNIKLHVMGEL